METKNTSARINLISLAFVITYNPSMNGQVLFQFENVSYKVGDLAILNTLSFQVSQGDFLVVLGSSGAGKSTLLRLFNLLLSPTEGEISYRGQTLDTDIRTLRQNVGFLFQSPAIFNGSVKDNMLLAGRWDNQIALIMDHELRSILDQVELFKIKLTQNARDLSGGEQQRLALARTLLNKPQVLLLDEPTASLGPKLSVSIMDLVKRLQSELKLTVIAVSHDHALMRNYAPRVILLEKGRLKASGSFQELDEQNAFQSDSYAENESSHAT